VKTWTGHKDNETETRYALTTDTYRLDITIRYS